MTDKTSETKREKYFIEKAYDKIMEEKDRLINKRRGSVGKAEDKSISIETGKNLSDAPKSESPEKYKCGHESETIIMKNNVLGLAAWAEWSQTKGFDGDKSQCFDCWLKSTGRLPKLEKEKCEYCGEEHETKTCPSWIEDELDNRKEDEELWSFVDLAKMIDKEKQQSELKGFNEGIDKAVKVYNKYTCKIVRGGYECDECAKVKRALENLKRSG